MERSLDLQERALEHLSAVYRMARQLAPDPDDAADLVQETYLTALTQGPKAAEEDLRVWLFRILHRLHRRRTAETDRTPVAGESLSSALSLDPRPGQPSPAWDMATLDWEHVDVRLRTAVERLQPEYRMVLLLWGVEELKYREIAEVLGVPIGTVMSRLSRARTILGEQLGDLARETGRLGA